MNMTTCLPQSILRAIVALIVCLVVPWTAVAEPQDVDYERQIKPLLAQHCVRCHGPLKQESELRLDAAQMIRKGGFTGEPLLPENVEDSLLLGVLTGDAGFVMPPEGEPLDEKEIELVRRWIEQGAPAPEQEELAPDPRDHWAFQTPARPEAPQPANEAWTGNPIDAFVAQEHEKRGLTPQAEAPRHLLLRRVYLDLVGVPPTPEQLEAFLADDSPTAYATVVDELLESPRYGERWGRHWMDVWRYSDWYGYRAELRNSARHIWRWRDWIVESLNDDKPYDRMLVEMLAADEAAPGDRDALRATGFLARNYYKFNRNTWLDDTVEHTAKAFLGATINCARCHDHMYDPVSQREYFAFRAIFEPHKIRTDPMPGELDTQKDGLSLSYDAQLDTQTFVYERGNDKHPLKDDPVAPAVPQALAGGDYLVEAVDVPVEMHYPGMRQYVRDEKLAAATQRLERAKKQLASMEAKQAERLTSAAGDIPVESREVAEASDVTEPDTSSTDTEAANLQLEINRAQKEFQAAEANLASLQSRIAADDARFADSPAANADELAQRADAAELQAAVLEAEAALATAEQSHAVAARAANDGDEKQKKALATAKRELDDAQAALEKARTAADKPDGKYEPLTPVYPSQSTGRRLALARWIADEQNPLTARVAVNHMWLRHFGTALVPSVFDFGLNGDTPTHPELLDWLAVDFMESGWSMKHLHRLIVLSNAYRMDSSASVASEENAAVDPDNRYLWRMNSRRMESELVRDSVLAVTGWLDATMGGPELDADQGHTTYRRSLYYRHAPEKSMLFLSLFDSASTQECYRREETVVPQQALALVNSPLSIEQSRRLAGELNRQAGTDDNAESESAYIDALFLRVLCRSATGEELRLCRQFLSEQTARLADAERLTGFPSDAKLAIDAASEPHLRARENLAHVLLNHNEFVTIR